MADVEALQNAFDEGYRRRAQEESNRTQDPQNTEMAQCFKGLQLELRCQNVINGVRRFAGGSSQSFVEWSQDMERVRHILQGDDERMRVLTLHTLTGSASKYGSRLVENNPGITWCDLKKALEDRYNDQADLQFARITLQQMKQKRGQSIQTFYEDLISTAKQAFRGDNLQDNWIQNTLVGIFMEGVQDEGLAKKLIRKRPDTLDRALEIAIEEAQTEKCYELRRGRVKSERIETPMEIDQVAVGGADSPIYQRLLETVDNMYTLIKNIFSANQISPNTREQAAAIQVARQFRNGPERPHGRPAAFTSGTTNNLNRANANWTPTGEPICFVCKGIGHMSKVCPTRRSKN